METVTLYAPDITCEHCVNAIKRAVGGLEGVSHVEGNPRTKQVSVTYDPDRVTLDTIKEVMTEEGYEPK